MDTDMLTNEENVLIIKMTIAIANGNESNDYVLMNGTEMTFLRTQRIGSNVRLQEISLHLCMKIATSQHPLSLLMRCIFYALIRLSEEKKRAAVHL